MRSALLMAVPAAACFSVVSQAQALTYAVWQGAAVITAATPNCTVGQSERSRIAPGAVLVSLVRPRLLLDNGNDSRMTFSNDSHSEFALALAGGLTIAGTGTYAAFGVTPSGVFKANVGGQYRAFVLAPANPVATTTFLSLTGTVDNFMFIPGCTVTFRGTYTLRP